MSEKKWTVKHSHHGSRGKLGKKRGTNFPRHAMNHYEGTHLGMRKRIWSKSNAGCVHRYGGAIVKSIYIIGLLNRFVGKPYKDFKFVYDAKIKNLVKNKDVTWWNLEDFLHKEPKTSYWRQEFYVDKNGLIQRCKLINRKSIWGPYLTKKQKRFNDRVKIPNIGICRDNAHYPVPKSSWGSYIDESSYYPHNKKNPILLGEFWVVVNKKVLKLPVYTCRSEFHVEYYNYYGYKYDYKLKKSVYTSYLDNHKSRDAGINKKREKLVAEWIPIRTRISNNLSGQDYWVETENVEVSDIKREIHNYKEYIKSRPDSPYINEWKKTIVDLTNKLEHIPKRKHYNMGYGKFYLYVKQEDFERESKRMVLHNQS